MLCLYLVDAVVGWGYQGHEIVAQIASEFLLPKTQTQIENLLGPASLASIASWADSVKNTNQYSWTKRLHYVDTHDELKCLYDDNLDCKQGDCIVGGITQFTKSVQCNKDIPEASRLDALKFIVHFVGDQSQPLHNCGRLVGGNKAIISYKGKSTNLHAIWDTDMVVDRLKQVAVNQDAYVSFLVKQIFQAKAPYWLSSYKMNQFNANGNALAAVEWSADASVINCQVVWSAYEQDPTQDFSVYYFQTNAGFIDLELAKAGYRLADWLNQVFGACL